MKEPGLCCGQISKGKNNTEDKNLPENPVVTSGLKIIYVGAGDLKLVGKTSGLTYYVSNLRRGFTADSRDAADILKDRSFILKP